MNTNQDIEGEIQWGLNYRQTKKKNANSLIVPKKSPLNVKEMWQKYQITKKIHDLELLNKHTFIKIPPNSFQLPSRNKVGFLKRAAFTKRQYFNYLAIPSKVNVEECEPDPITVLKKKLKPQKCSARLIELAKPRKLRVYCTWVDFLPQLPGEAIERLDAILRTDRTLDPTFARCYFASMDRRKNKEKRKQRRKEKKKRKKREQEHKKWLKFQTTTTADLIISFLCDSVPNNLNYKQTLLTNVIIDQLKVHHQLKFKPLRNSKKVYHCCIYEIVDQIAIWIDSVACFVDAQYTDSVEEITKESSLVSLFEFGEGEEEGDTAIQRFVLPPTPSLPNDPVSSNFQVESE